MTSAADPYPSDEEIRKANEGLIAIVRDRLPMGFYREADQWSKWSTAALVRMADTVEAAMSLMEAGLEVDARTLLRSLYEQVVTFAWLGIDPGPRFSRWFGDGLLEDLRLHNDAQPFGITILDEHELADTKRLLKLRDEDEAPREPDCAGKHRRKSNKPDAALVLPPVPQRAIEADKHWAERIAGLHPHRHPLGFAGLYLLCFRVAGRSVHPTMNALHPYITEKPTRHAVHRATGGDRLMWALFAPLFGIALMIAAQEATWIDEAKVRELVDQATGPEHTFEHGA